MTSPQHQVPGPSWHTTLSRASIPSWSSCKSCENRGSDTIARFLSPDPYVQLPNNTQSYNRYSYCMNNPLNLVDLTGEMFWKPDEDALLNNNEVRFIAEEGDDLFSLSTQTGISLDVLQKHYGSINFEAGKSYSFDKIPAINQMNNFLQNANTDINNCRAFALSVNNINVHGFSANPSVLNGWFVNIPAPMSQTGDVITFGDTYEKFHADYWDENIRIPDYQMNEAEFKRYYEDNFSRVITHYGNVLLKNHDGSNISWIIEKRGINKVNLSPYPQSTTKGNHSFPPYRAIPAVKTDNFPFYRKLGK